MCLFVVDHEKQEFYVRFLFVIIEGDMPVEQPEPKTRGPYPASVLWVPTYQVGAKRGMTITDDSKVMWLPKGVCLSQIDEASFEDMSSNTQPSGHQKTGGGGSPAPAPKY